MNQLNLSVQYKTCSTSFKNHSWVILPRREENAILYKSSPITETKEETIKTSAQIWIRNYINKALSSFKISLWFNTGPNQAWRDKFPVMSNCPSKLKAKMLHPVTTNLWKYFGPMRFHVRQSYRAQYHKNRNRQLIAKSDLLLGAFCRHTTM